MKIIQEINLPYFEFWSGAKDNAAELTYDQLEELEGILEAEYPDGMDATDLNDLMWFDFDMIKEWLGIEDEEEDEDEDEDEFEEESLRLRTEGCKGKKPRKPKK